MSLCPNCQTMDKEFFAPKCHACNTPVGFFEQIFFSLIYSVAQLLAFGLLIWMIVSMI